MILSILPIPLRASLPAKKSLNPIPKLQFGCRLAGAMASAQSEEGDRFVKSITLALPEYAAVQGNLKESVNPFASLLQNDQSDGWGVAHFIEETDQKSPFKLQQTKSERNVLKDPDFKVIQQHLDSEATASGIGHVRKDSHKTGSKTENSHPFRLDMDESSWTFAHNGRWDQALSRQVKESLRANPTFQPQGDTDSEHAFLYLMQSIHKKLGTLNTEKAGIDPMKRAFAEGIRELTEEPATPVSHTIPEQGLNIHGKVRVGPSYNFVANDGHLMIAYCHGQSLYLGVKLDSKRQPIAHAVSSVPKKLPGVIWTDLPDNTVVVINRNPDTGKSQAEILPLETIPPL